MPEGKEIKIPKRYFQDHVTQYNLIDKLKPELETHLRISSDSHKISRVFKGVDHNTPWIHVKQDPDRQCHAYQMIFERLGFIPRACENCWKVVVRPRNIYELYQLWDLQKTLNRPSKCGIEVRPYVQGLYGGYFYNNGKEEGTRCKELVRKGVDEWISPECPVILKRYCTEFEMQFGPSNQYVRPEGADEWEARAFRNIDLTPDKLDGQPGMLLQDVEQRWIKWAWKYDPDREAVAKFTDGKSIYPELVTY